MPVSASHLTPAKRTDSVPKRVSDMHHSYKLRILMNLFTGRHDLDIAILYLIAIKLEVSSHGPLDAQLHAKKGIYG